MTRRIAYRRLRDDVAGRLMPIQTLNLLLATHKRDPAQQLYLFGWRNSPDNKLTIYDMDLPRRTGISEECTRGRGHDDWWLNSTICNVPGDYMTAWGRGEIPGYKIVLMRLLREGSVVPSRCLSDWLQDDSRKWCSPELRIRYKDN